jgi:hypothetical protein
MNYVFPIIHDCLPTLGQVFDPTLEEIRWFGSEEVVKPILELSVGGNSKPHRLLESGRGGNPMAQGLESTADVEESSSRVPEWPLSSCLQCMVEHCHAEE